MNTVLYVMPTATTTLPGDSSTTIRIPKYAAAGLPLAGKSYVAIPFGLEPVVLVASDPNPQVSANPDVLTIQDLDQLMSVADVTKAITFFEAMNVPANGIVAAGLTWRQVLRVIAGVFQFAHRLAGQSGQAIFIGTGATLDSPFANLSVSAQTAVLNAAQAFNIPVPALAVASAQQVSPTQINPAPGPIQPVSINPSTLTGNSSIRSLLISMGQQWNAPLIMNRGDGFVI